MTQSTKHPESLSVIGLGYVGLPLALLASEKGFQVNGIDIDANKVKQINQGHCPLADQVLADQLTAHPFPASTDHTDVTKANIIVVAVPTPVDNDNQPDLSPLTSALKSILPYLRTGQTLIIESTINPGVMDEVIIPLLQQRPDLPLDADHPSADQPTLYLVHCPERINPGDTQWSLRNIPRVLGGFSTAGTKRARTFYQGILEAPIKVMASATEAEAVKILENTFRDVNIAFINEMAKSFAKLGIDITNVIDGAATKPFAFMPHFPGNGVGGHCISVDPYYMIERARQVGFDHKFLKLARQINESMPAYTVALLERSLQNLGLSLANTPIALLGVAYKKDVSDIRNSPALKAAELLRARGAHLHIYDPFVPEQSTVASLAEALAPSQAILLACDHSSLVDALTPGTLKQAGIRLVVDGKNCLSQTPLVQAGISYQGIGRSSQPHTQPTPTKVT